MNLFTCDCCGSQARDQHKVTGGVVCADCINDADAMLMRSEKQQLRAEALWLQAQNKEREAYRVNTTTRAGLTEKKRMLREAALIRDEARRLYWSR